MAKVNLYLDTRKGKDVCPLKIMVSHLTKTAYIGLDISLSPKQWDKASGKVVNHPKKAMLNSVIQRRMLDVEDRLLEYSLSHNMHAVSVTQLRDVLMGKDVELSVTFGTELKKFIELKNGRTRDIYQATYNKVNAFVGGEIGSLPFESMTREWLTRFDNSMMAEGLKTNSRNIHMRNIRAVFNFAIDNELITCYPFRRFHLKTEATPKRSLSVEQLREFFAYPDLEEYQVKYLDMFKLIFFLIGINITDLLHLKEVTAGGRIEYYRAKTHKLYSIKVEPEAMEIINRYHGEEWLLNPLDTYSSVNNYLPYINDALKAIGEHRIVGKGGKKERKPLHPDITTYWARHTWASIAAELDIPKETISAALGHNMGSPITSIYIDFNQKKVDEANRRVIDYVLYNKK